MLKTSLTQSVKNLPLLIGAEDVNIRSKTSFTIRLAKNLPSNIVEDAEVGSNGDDGNDKIVRSLPSFRMSSGSIRISYLVTL